MSIVIHAHVEKGDGGCLPVNELYHHGCCIAFYPAYSRLIDCLCCWTGDTVTTAKCTAVQKERTKHENTLSENKREPEFVRASRRLSGVRVAAWLSGGNTASGKSADQESCSGTSR